MLIYAAGLFALLLCCCGLALDLGSFELTRLRMQNAADAAALGAVVASQNGGNLSNAGLGDAAQNGFNSGTDHVTVSLSNPPPGGAYAGNASAVRAVITKQVTGTFIPAKVNLSVQATALGSPGVCVYLLSQNTTSSLVAANQVLQASCTFYIGRSYTFGGGAYSTGSTYLVSGNKASSVGSVTPNPIFNSPSKIDPLGSVPAPSVTGCTYTNLTITAAATLLSGTYCGGLTISTTATVSLMPGTYIILGSLTINNPRINAAGVTFYMSQGNGYSYGSGSISNLVGTLSAPASGPLKGLLYFTDRTIPAGHSTLTVQNWNRGTRLDGVLYLSGQQLVASNVTLQGNNYFGIVADSCSMNNTDLLPSTDYSTLVGGGPFAAAGGGAGLVE